MGSLKKILLGADGRLRPFLCALIYSALAFWVFSADGLMGPVFGHMMEALHLGDLSPATIAFFEAINLVTALLLTWLFAMYERRKIDSYGFLLRKAFRAEFWEGFAIGVINGVGVAVGMIALGGMSIHGLALHGATILWSALAWFGANMLIGVAEEILFRGYLLRSLWRSVGFWPAAVLIGLWFAADHYFFKEGENIWDVITLFSLALWTCYTVLRTGTLWMAIGYHVAFDYMQLFVIGTKNGNDVPVRHLLDASFQGPAWVNGGVLGTEASFLMYPLIALMFVYVWWRFRQNAPVSEDQI
jgi:uncharacterized protein